MNANSIPAFLNFATRFIDRSRAQILQDLWVLWEMGPRAGTFLDIGAGDGEFLSNTWLLERCGWRGALVEPNRRHYPKLARRSAPAFLKAAWSRSGETLALRSVTDDLELSRLETVEAMDSHEAAGARASFETDLVETITVADLIAEAGLPEHVDYLSIDIEGAELEVLAAIDLDRIRFGCITVEHNDTPARQRIHDLLAGHGYRRKFTELSAWDDWYVLDSAQPPVPDLDHATRHAVGRLRQLWLERGHPEQAERIAVTYGALWRRT